MLVKDSYTEASDMEYASADSLHSFVDPVQPKVRCSTATSLYGGDLNAEWSKISSGNELNDDIDAVSSLREYTRSVSANKNDGAFDLEDDVLFYSKVDSQYISGVIKAKKKDKLTKDYVYKIQKVHKRDPEVDAELAAKKRSAKEDPRVEIIKMREQRAKKMATITWNVKNQEQSYYKIMSANDFHIELQIAMLNLLKSRLKDYMKRKKKRDKVSSKADRIAAKNAKSKAKRDRKQKFRTFTGSRHEILELSEQAQTLKKEGSDTVAGIPGISEHIRAESLYLKNISKPEGDPNEWDEEDVLTWLQWISQEACSLENEESLRDEERLNLTQARQGLLDNYLDKFINAEVNGKKLSEMDTKSLSNVVYMNNPLERKIMMKCLEDLFGVRTKVVKASEYSGTDAKFIEWKKSNIEEIKFQKRKAEMGSMRNKTVSEIGINEDFVMPEYADKTIAETRAGTMFAERLDNRAGMDVEGDNRQLMKMLLHANVPIPKELTTPVKGHHTIQNRNAQLRNLLMKHQAVMDKDADWYKREAALKEARSKFELDDKKKTRDALKSGNLSEITTVYGTKHKKLKEIMQHVEEQVKQQKKEEQARKLDERKRTNESNLSRTAKLKKLQQSGVSADLTGSPMMMVAAQAKMKSKRDRHHRKRSNSTDFTLTTSALELHDHLSNDGSMSPSAHSRSENGGKRVSWKGDAKRPQSARNAKKKGFNAGSPAVDDTLYEGRQRSTSSHSSSSHRKNAKKKKKKKGHSVQFSDEVHDKTTRRFRKRQIPKRSSLSPEPWNDPTYDASSEKAETPEIQRGYKHMMRYKKRHRNQNTSVVVNSIHDSEDMLLSDLNDDGIDMMSDEEEDEDDEKGQSPYLSPSSAVPLSMRRLTNGGNASIASSLSSDGGFESDTTYETAASWREVMSPMHELMSSTSSSSEITFSSDDPEDDDDDDDDADGNDGNAVPLSVLRMRARAQIEKNPKHSTH